MYTQCSKCGTVFRLSADSLRAAAGQVRCGRCGEVFSALTRLAEDAAGFTQGESPPDMPPHPEDAVVPPGRVDDFAVAEPQPQFAAWVAVAIALAFLLVFQIIRGNRELAPPSAALAAYQVRQWGVSDPDAPAPGATAPGATAAAAKGTLRVRASILNTAGRSQPVPLLRVTLVNRFGVRIGTREFEPAEYLDHRAVRPLNAGERVNATLDILDPGQDAEGFEIDVCLRGAGQTIFCAADTATPPS